MQVTFGVITLMHINIFIFKFVKKNIYVKVRYPLRCHLIQRRVQCLSEENALRESRLVQCIVLVLQPRHDIPHRREHD